MTCDSLTHGPQNPDCTCPLAEEMDREALARFKMATLGYVAVKWLSIEEIREIYPPKDPDAQG